VNRIIGIVLSGAALICSQAAVAQLVDDEDEIGNEVAIGNLIYNGSGCERRGSLRLLSSIPTMMAFRNACGLILRITSQDKVWAYPSATAGGIAPSD